MGGGGETSLRRENGVSLKKEDGEGEKHGPVEGLHHYSYAILRKGIEGSLDARNSELLQPLAEGEVDLKAHFRHLPTSISGRRIYAKGGVCSSVPDSGRAEERTTQLTFDLWPPPFRRLGAARARAHSSRLDLPLLHSEHFFRAVTLPEFPRTAHGRSELKEAGLPPVREAKAEKGVSPSGPPAHSVAF